ncbi:MAG: hypothetical protein VCB14_05515 [Alphaproteobacteria bacterium]
MSEWFATRRSTRAILVGDLNVAPLENDVWSHKALLQVVSHTPIEVETIKKLMTQGIGWMQFVTSSQKQRNFSAGGVAEHVTGLRITAGGDWTIFG